MNKQSLSVLSVILVIIVIIQGVLLLQPQDSSERNGQETESTDKQQSARQDTNQAAMMRVDALPEGVKPIGDCVPQMGQHYANPAELPKTPIYVADGKTVIGVEYIMPESVAEKTTSRQTPHGPFIAGEEFNYPALDIDVDHVSVQYVEQGMEGVDEPVYAVHVYGISENEVKNVTCS